MPKCKLIIDTCCDLPYEIVEIDDIEIFNFSYEIGGGTFKDDLFKTLEAKDFYDQMRDKKYPTTSQLAIPLLEEAFENVAKQGIPTVYLAFSSGLSGTYDQAMLVADQVRESYPDFELYIVDTRLASIAEGLLVYEAIKQWERNLSAKELADWAEEARYYVDEVFMVEDLETLHKGGRIPASVAVAGSALDVKPLLNIDYDGKLQVIGVARGRKKGIKQLVDYYNKHVDKNSSNYVIIAGADCPKDLHKLHEAIQKLDESTIIIESSIGPVIGSHVGPGMIAISFWGSNKKENMSIADRIANKIRKNN